MNSRGWVLGVLVGSSLGCGKRTTSYAATLDTATVRRSVDQVVVLNTDMTPSAVECPPEDRMTGPIGHTFTCMNVKTSLVDFRIDPTGEGLASVEAAESSIKEWVSPATHDAMQIACGEPRFLVIKPGRKRQCRVTIGNKQGTGTVTLQDDQGNFGFQTDF